MDFLSYPRARTNRSSVFVAGLILLLPLWGAAQSWMQESHVEIRNAVMPVYFNFDPHPAALLKVEHIFNDYQTRGFFRIGALPALILDGVTLELKDPTRLTNALAEYCGRFCLKKGVRKAVEARKFRLVFSSHEDGQICARWVHLESSAKWRLQDGTFARPGAKPVAFRSATLVFSGPQAGEFVCQTRSGEIRFPLTSLISNT